MKKLLLPTLMLSLFTLGCASEFQRQSPSHEHLMYHESDRANLPQRGLPPPAPMKHQHHQDDMYHQDKRAEWRHPGLPPPAPKKKHYRHDCSEMHHQKMHHYHYEDAQRHHQMPPHSGPVE